MKNKFLYLSLVIIGIYWISGILRTPSPLPADIALLFWYFLPSQIIVVGVVYALLSLQGESFVELGFTKVNWTVQVLRGVLFGIVAWILTHLVLQQILTQINPEPPGIVHVSIYFDDFRNVLLLIFIGMVGGGLVEEIERIFILTRFKQWLGATGIIIGLIVGSIVFGVAHLYQGTNGAIMAGCSGLCFGLVYLRKGLALEAVSCHAFYNAGGLLVGYLMHQ